MPATATTSPKRFSTPSSRTAGDRGARRRRRAARRGAAVGMARSAASVGRAGATSSAAVRRRRAVRAMSPRSGRAMRTRGAARGVSSRRARLSGRHAIDSRRSPPCAVRSPRPAPLARARVARRWRPSPARPGRRRRRRRSRRDVGRAARGQPHRQGLHVPADARRPRAGRDRPAPRRQRRPGRPRGGHRRPAVQDAWEGPRPPTAGAPPGPTPAVSVRPDVAGLRIVVASGERVDVVWTVPAERRPARLVVGCHIPGHWDAGHAIPVRWVDGAGAAPARSRLVSAPVVRSRSAPAGRARRRLPSLEEDRRMAYVIAEPCIDVLDMSCVSVCPVDCIHYEEGIDRKLFIDPNECIDCGACEPECPVNAIFPEESLPPEWAKFTPIDATWYTDKAAARAAVDEQKPRLSRAAGPRPGRAPVRADRSGPVPRCASSRSSRPPPRSCAPSASRTSSSAVTHECDWPPSVVGKPVVTRSVHDLAGAAVARRSTTGSRDAIHGGSSLYALDEEALGGRRARPDPDPGAVPRLRGQLPRGQRGRPPDRRRHHRRVARADLDRGHPQHDLDGRRDDRGRGRRGRARRGACASGSAPSSDGSRSGATAGHGRRGSSALEWLDPPFAVGHWVPEQIRRAGGWDLLGSDGEQGPRRRPGTRSPRSTRRCCSSCRAASTSPRPSREWARTAAAATGSPTCRRSGAARSSRSTDRPYFSRARPAGHRRHRDAGRDHGSRRLRRHRPARRLDARSPESA